MAQQDPADGRITTALRDGMFLIGIDRPAKLNGFTPVMLRGLAQAYTAFEHELQAHCAVVFAEGPHFTAGLDLPKVAPHLGGNTLLVEEGEIDPFGLRPPFRSKPVVVAVQGICFTFGVELMLAADIVIAASDTRFAQLEVKRGLLPSGGATIRQHGTEHQLGDPAAIDPDSAASPFPEWQKPIFRALGIRRFLFLKGQ